MKQCRSCAHFVKPKPDQPIGLCKLNPPQVQITPMRNNLAGQVMYAPIAYFPSLDEKEWCSQHAPKLQEVES